MSSKNSSDLITCLSSSGYLQVLTPEDLEKEHRNLAELKQALFVDDVEYMRRQSEIDFWSGRKSTHRVHTPASTPSLQPSSTVQLPQIRQPERVISATSPDSHWNRKPPSPPQSHHRPSAPNADQRGEFHQRNHHRDADPIGIKLYPTRNWAAKYWLGFPLSHSDIAQLQRASARLGSRFKEPHMSLGWCILTDYLHKAECGSILAEFQKIGAEMRRALELRHTGFEVVGAEKNKVAAFYQPFDKRKSCFDDELFLQFNERILNLFRAAAKRLAEKRSVPFRSYLDPQKDRAIEIGEVGEIRVYEMKAVRPTFHVTVGSHGAANQKHLVESIRCNPIEIPTSELFYMEEGKRRKI